MKKIIVDCESNDPLEIKYGGPPMLGFNFYINDNDVEGIRDFVLTELHKYKLPCLNISIIDTSSESFKPWSRKEISDCIKAGY